MRRGLPDRHRHPRRPAARMHRLRPVHRCLQRRDGEVGRPPELITLDTFANQAARAPAGPAGASASCGRAPSSTPASCVLIGSGHAGRPLGARRGRGQRAARPHAAVRHAVRRLDPQRLHAQDPQQEREPQVYALSLAGLAGATLSWSARRAPAPRACRAPGRGHHLPGPRHRAAGQRSTARPRTSC